MMERTTSPEETSLDFSSLLAIAGGDEKFVAALLAKMCKVLPVAFQNMEEHAAAQDWASLKAAAHKAKSTFAYLNIEEMRLRLGQIEHSAMEEMNVDHLPQIVGETVAIGRKILGKLQAELQRIAGIV